MLDEVSHLFRDHPDLLKEFTYFLPDAVQEVAKSRLSAAAARSERRLMKQRRDNKRAREQANQRASGKRPLKRARLSKSGERSTHCLLSSLSIPVSLSHILPLCLRSPF